MVAARSRIPAAELEPVILRDPQAIKALAHPARLAVIDEFFAGRKLTATEAAEIAGLSASAMSYHLRALEKWGFVERAESSGDGRERPWRGVAGGRWSIDAMPDQVTAQATHAVTGLMMDRLRGDLSRWFEREGVQPQEWRDAAIIENSRLWLTPVEMGELTDLVQGFVDDHRNRTAADHPEGARAVRLTRVAVPVQLD
jgi:DNA-binding transcriptional ArsR family regulator